MGWYVFSRAKSTTILSDYVQLLAPPVLHWVGYLSTPKFETCHFYCIVQFWLPYFQQCSAACGTGVQTRTIQCVSVYTHEPVSDDMCEAGKRPTETRGCFIQPCPGKCMYYILFPDHWNTYHHIIWYLYVYNVYQSFIIWFEVWASTIVCVCTIGNTSWAN